MSSPVAPDGPGGGSSAPSLIAGLGAALVGAAVVVVGDGLAAPPPQATARTAVTARIVANVLRMSCSFLKLRDRRPPGPLTPLAHLRIARAAHASAPSPLRSVGARRRRRRPWASCTSPPLTGRAR